MSATRLGPGCAGSENHVNHVNPVQGSLVFRNLAPGGGYDRSWPLCCDDALLEANGGSIHIRLTLLRSAFLVGAFAPHAGAQLTLGADVAYYSWKEVTQPLAVTEHGALLAFDLDYLQQKKSGFLVGYRGRIYFGGAAYAGAQLFAPDVSISSTTGYLGTVQEGQLRFRTAGELDLLGAVGADIWRRQLSSSQGEDYRMLFVALGFEYNTGGAGVTFGARINYPVWTVLDAHATAVGLDQNPTLTLGQDLGASLEFGYRFASRLALIGYFESFRFKASDERPVTRGGGEQGLFFEPAVDTYLLGVKVEFGR